MKVTDYERVAEVASMAACPKCGGVCTPAVRGGPGRFRRWDCRRCGRGWVEVPDRVTTAAEALEVDTFE